MAVYAATVTLDQRSAAKLGNGGFKLLSGQVALTNYNSTPAGITGISGEFATLFRVICDGVSSSGYLVRWSKTDNALKAYYPSVAITPAGTVAAPTFTGSALAAHRHVLHFQTSAAANAVTAAANSLRTAAAAFDVAGVANSSGEGGIVDVTAGTPAGTNSAPAFTGTAVVAAGGTEVANDVNVGTVNFIAFGV